MEIDKKGNASSKIDGKLISKLGYLKSNEEINSMSDTKDNIKKKLKTKIFF
jgi:hypothetical protein